MKRERKRVQLCCPAEELITEQSHKPMCDINNIVNRFNKTGVIEHRNEHRGQYGFATSSTYQDAMYIVARAQSMFNELPSHIRKKFKNDPSNFMDFVQDPKNSEEMVKLGLATKREDLPGNTQQFETAVAYVKKHLQATEPEESSNATDGTS